MKEYKPKISVIMPTFNRCYVVWKAINSVLKQTYPFFELLIIDDGSQDDTGRLVKEFSDPRIKYFRSEKNKGASAARNYGLKKAKAELIAYLDSDNAWYPEFLEAMNSAFDKNKDKVIIFCKKNYKLTLINKKGEEVPLRDETTYSKRYFALTSIILYDALIPSLSRLSQKESSVFSSTPFSLCVQA